MHSVPVFLVSAVALETTRPTVGFIQAHTYRYKEHQKNLKKYRKAVEARVHLEFYESLKESEKALDEYLALQQEQHNKKLKEFERRLQNGKAQY